MAPIRRYLRITKYSVLEVRIYLDNPHASIPVVNTGTRRQFVVSANKLSFEAEAASREAFWFREEFLKRVNGGWREPATGRKGAIDRVQRSGYARRWVKGVESVTGMFGSSVRPAMCAVCLAILDLVRCLFVFRVSESVIGMLLSRTKVHVEESRL